MYASLLQRLASTKTRMPAIQIGLTQNISGTTSLKFIIMIPPPLAYLVSLRSLGNLSRREVERFRRRSQFECPSAYHTHAYHSLPLLAVSRDSKGRLTCGEPPRL